MVRSRDRKSWASRGESRIGRVLTARSGGGRSDARPTPPSASDANICSMSEAPPQKSGPVATVLAWLLLLGGVALIGFVL